ncbi:MAG: adenylate/guanylate cyclase domain-containing protein [Anaerolineae bacterium]
MPQDDARLSALSRSMPAGLAGKVLAARGQVEGERKVVTILFVDMVNSTGLAERLDPEEYAEIVNGSHRRVAQQVYRYEGIIAQLLGDGVLCFFGAPVSHEDDPERAVHAALGIIEACQAYTAELARRQVAFHVRIGIHTGLVIVDKISTGQQLQYFADGSTISLASQLQSHADPDTILISQNTFHSIEPLFDTVERDALTIPGRSASVCAYQVRGVKPGGVKRRGLPGVSSPMVGRQRELATLVQFAENLRRGQGGIVAVIGEAGLGKSRLIAEWEQWVRASADEGVSPLSWAEGRARSYGVTMGYHLIIDLARSLLGVPSVLDRQDLQAALQSRLHALFAEDSALYAEGYPYMAHLLGLLLEPPWAERLQYVDPQTLQTQYALAIHRAFRTLTAIAPTVIVLDDVHWADAQSVDLIRRLLPLVADRPLLLCLAMRPENTAPAWKLLGEARDLPGVGLTELYLTALSSTDSESLVTNLLGRGDLPVSLHDLILSRAEGNPFFVEEVIRILIDRGILQPVDGEWVSAETAGQIAIPDTLKGLLMARIDQLPEDVRHTLRVASVLGREFSFQLLLKVLQEK